MLAVAVRARGLACRLPHGDRGRQGAAPLRAVGQGPRRLRAGPALEETKAAVAGLAAAARDGLGGQVCGEEQQEEEEEGAKKSPSPPPPLVEVLVSLEGASLDFEHHPFEAELARTLPAGADTAARAALWSRALEGVVGSVRERGGGSV